MQIQPTIQAAIVGGHSVRPRLVDTHDLLHLPEDYAGPILIAKVAHTLRGEKTTGPDAEAFNARPLMQRAAALDVPIVYLSERRSFKQDSRFLASFPRSIMVSGQSKDRRRGSPDALSGLLGRLRVQYPKASFYVLGSDAGDDAQVCQATPGTHAYIHNVDPSQSNVPSGFKGVLSDDYTPEFQARLLGDLSGTKAPTSPAPLPMPRYTRFDRWVHSARFAATLAAGAGSELVSMVHRHCVDPSATVAALKSGTSLAFYSPSDLSAMADGIIYGHASDRSALLMRLVTAHGNAPGAVDAIVTRTHDPEHFESRLSAADRVRYQALQDASRAVPGDWDGWQSYMDRATGSHVAPGTRMQNFIDGAASFQAQYDAIDHARNFVNLSIHTFASDQAGWEYAKHLADAADRGCKVRVLYDAYGSATSMGQPTDPRLWQYLKDHGVEVIEQKSGPLYAHLTHRKILATDDGVPGSNGIVAFTGGVNIADYHRDYWHDVFSRITGTGAGDLSSLFVRQWAQNGGTLDGAQQARVMAAQPAYADGGLARVVAHDGFKDRNMKLAYLRAIDTATTSIDIADPYFTDKDVYAHLEAAARRGVKVRLFWPHDDNQKSTQYAAREAYPALLSAGVEIYEYAGLPMAHNKIAVFDGRMVTNGSSNLDARSLVNNDEANIWLDDRQVAADLTTRYFDADVPNSYRITSYHAGPLEAAKNRMYTALDSFI